MAYPNPIESNNIGNTKDFLEYFKGCLIDYASHEFSEDYYDRWVSFISEFQALPALPISRANFYLLIRNNFATFNGEYLYSYNEPNSGWSVRLCNDWGKLKIIEQALFGDTTSSGGNSMASVNGTKFLESIPKWTSASMSYLRYGLCRFDNYGTGIVPEIKRPAPTSPITNVSARTFNWTNAPGFTALTDYEYSHPAQEWTTVTQKPIVIPASVELDIRDFVLRTKGEGYILPSDGIYNTSSIPLNATICSISNVGYYTGEQGLGFYATININSTLVTQIVVTFKVMFGDLESPTGQGIISAGNLLGIGFVPYTTFTGDPTQVWALVTNVTPNPAGGREIVWNI